MSENQITLAVIIMYLITVWIANVILTYNSVGDSDLDWLIALIWPLILVCVPIFLFFNSASSFAKWLKQRESK